MIALLTTTRLNIRRFFPARYALALAAALLGVGMLASSAAAQGRGGRGGGFGARGGRRILAGRRAGGRFSPGSALYPGYYGYYGDYDYDYEVAPQPQPEQFVTAQPAPPPPVVASPGLVLEEHDGQWVRIPTGNEQAVGPATLSAQGLVNSQPLNSQAGRTNSVAGSNPQISAQEAAAPVAPLPAAVLVFRDGHREEVTRYLIRGDSLYIGADYWSTGSWTRRIPVTALDVPASLKANADRGANFNLPTAANEVVVRF